MTEFGEKPLLVFMHVLIQSFDNISMKVLINNKFEFLSYIYKGHDAWRDVQAEPGVEGPEAEV